MAPHETPSEMVLVRRLRLSYVSTRTHDQLREIGRPDTFASVFSTPRVVAGVALQRPFAADTPVDQRFWSTLAETTLTSSVPPATAEKMVKYGVPLRHAGGLDAPGGPPVVSGRIEAHVRPHGISALSTIDCTWDNAIPLEEAWESVDGIAEREVDVRLGGASRKSTLEEATKAGAELMIAALAEAEGTTWEQPDHRLASVIEGSTDRVPGTMPAPDGPLRMGLHRLSRGREGLPDPDRSFVAQWNGATFSWVPTNLVYMLDAGTSILSPAASGPAPRPQTSLGARHRRAILLLGHLAAAVGLVKAARSYKKNPFFEQWAKWAADALGRLYAPVIASYEWGLEARAFLHRLGAIEDVNVARGSPLTPKPDFPDPRWGP